MSLSNLPPGTWEGDPRAPWNQPEAPTCEECGAEGCREGEYCRECGEYVPTEEEANEPDWDSMPGGADDDDRGFRDPFEDRQP